jgi:hypothetical protein
MRDDKAPSAAENKCLYDMVVGCVHGVTEGNGARKYRDGILFGKEARHVTKGHFR